MGEGTAIINALPLEVKEEISSAHRKLRAMASEMILTEERERQHIASVLQDGVVQTLVALKMKFEELQGLISFEHLSGPVTLAELEDLINLSIQQARSLIAELSPPILYRLGFIPAMEWLTEHIESNNRIPIDFEADRTLGDFAQHLQVLLFQATRELLMNVVEHAKATEVVVTVSGDSGRVQVDVKDDGVGFAGDPAGNLGKPGSGFGLFSIRERLEHYGGCLEILSRIGKGTRVTLVVPVNTGNNRGDPRDEDEAPRGSGGKRSFEG